MRRIVIDKLYKLTSFNNHSNVTIAKRDHSKNIINVCACLHIFHFFYGSSKKSDVHHSPSVRYSIAKL